MMQHEGHSVRRDCDSPAESQSSKNSDYTTDIYQVEKGLGCLYTEIMQVCQPFYALSRDTGGCAINIPPRLEDGLRNEASDRFCAGQENPQDDMATFYQSMPQPSLSNQTNSHVFRRFNDR